MSLTHRKASGTYFAMGFWGELTEGSTLSCCHCQFTRILQKGSGAVWHWCPHCAGYHCGGPECRECVPVELRLENLEAGRHLLTPAKTRILIPSAIETVRG